MRWPSGQSYAFTDEIRSYISAAERHDGVLDPLNLVNKYLYDPMIINDFNVTESGRMTNFRVMFKHMLLTGLKGLDIDSMRFNLGKSNARARNTFSS